MSNFDITELLTDRQTDERTDEWKSGHLTELLTDRQTDERTDEWKSGHLCCKVGRSGRCFIQGLMVV